MHHGAANSGEDSEHTQRPLAWIVEQSPQQLPAKVRIYPYFMQQSGRIAWHATHPMQIVWLIKTALVQPAIRKEEPPSPTVSIQRASIRPKPKYDFCQKSVSER